ncbi:hypothetical protein P3T24_005888 [Paraburkholderia sp. GAS33]|jgi:hypothetical protein|uniref:hypothetical protein n=1 Tax=unclassified Paraburkholderia TaxID=2615204 RepID=UPI003D1B3459
MNRPVSITVLAWYSILSTLITTPFMFKTQTSMTLLGLPIGFTYHLIVVSVQIISAVGLLRGLPWARLLFVGRLVFVTAVIAVKMSSSQMIAALPIVAIIDGGVFFVLYRSSAEVYFGKKYTVQKLKQD